MICVVCGQPGTRGHEHTVRVLCAEHSAWWTEALTERTGPSDWDRFGDLDKECHDDLMSAMRRDYEDALYFAGFETDPLDGLSLEGVGVSP